MQPIEHNQSLSERARRFWQDRILTMGTLYLLVMPTLLSLAVFSYYPKIDVVFKSLYRWEPPAVQEFVGLKNFMDAFADPLFWNSFQLIGILLCANLIKMIPGILAAIAIHRVLSDRVRYYYQVGFVVPMVVPSIVWILMWKGFYDPDFGIVNKILNGTGLMSVLQALDGTADAPGIMPSIAGVVSNFTGSVTDPIFGNTWGILLAGAFILALGAIKSKSPLAAIPTYALLVGLAVLLPVLLALGFISGLAVLSIGLVGGMALLISLSRRIGDAWILWPFLVLGGILAYLPFGQLGRLPATMAACIAIVFAIRSLLPEFKAQDWIKRIGYLLIVSGGLLVAFGMVWTDPTGQFMEGKPAWLGSEDLVIPAIIFWGFPWVGAVSVLIFLSGLQQISADVYEAAELDGLSAMGKIFYIELPLIVTQIRISLIMLTISTLTAYEQFLILLGPEGGVGNKGLVPGLYMFKTAFQERQFGYACALGMVLFVIILTLTIIYNKYVKVDK